MRGRYSLTKPAAVAELLGLPTAPELPPRYNVAPSQLVVVAGDGDRGRRLAMAKWGFTPPWSPSALLLNAKAETVATKPTFRDAFRHRRCQVLADGFFEWAKVGKKKQPYWFRMADGSPFAFAGLWEMEEGRAACCVITTEPNELVAPVHDRMPAIMPPEHFDQWLDPNQHDPAQLLPLLVPFPADRMTATSVSTKVNSAKFDSPECVEPAA